MKALSVFLNHLYIKTTTLITTILIQFVFNLHSFAGTFTDSGHRLIAATQFINLIEQNIPSIRHRMIGEREFRSSSDVRCNECCAVCLCDFEGGDWVRKLKCDHLFHRDCVDEWLQQEYAPACPLCRREVLPENVVGKYRRKVPISDDYSFT